MNHIKEEVKDHVDKHKDGHLYFLTMRWKNSAGLIITEQRCFISMKLEKPHFFKSQCVYYFSDDPTINNFLIQKENTCYQ